MEQIKEYEYVDLGLPSDLKWAKCNVGAEKETDYGYYFQWGDIEDKSNANCDWSSYKHGDGSKFSKYNPVLNGYSGTIDGEVTLDLDDDAAVQIMGGDWRMPTKDEIQELTDNTDSEWVENFNGSGVNGGKFTSKVNGKSVFFPAAGVCSNSYVFHVNSIGNYWAAENPNDRGQYFACHLYFNSGNFLVEYLCYYWYFGFSVRGVCKR